MARKKLTPAQQAASDKIGKILAKKDLCVWEKVDGQLRCRNCYIYASGLNAKGERVCKLKAGIPPTLEESAQSLRAFASNKISQTMEMLEKANEQATKEVTGQEGPSRDSQEAGRVLGSSGQGQAGGLRDADSNGSVGAETRSDNLKSWQVGLCERLSKGESLGAILNDYEVAPAKFFKELDENPELKKAHDDAMRCAARLAEYNLMYLAVSGTSADKKALAPGLIEKYGGEAPKVSGEESQEGEATGL